jgi:hypothetical protein
MRAVHKWEHEDQIDKSRTMRQASLWRTEGNVADTHGKRTRVMLCRAAACSFT